MSSFNYNKPVDSNQFITEAKELLEEHENECGWMYTTKHVSKKEIQSNLFEDQKNEGKINYTVWSDVFICPYCNQEYVFFDVAFDKKNKSVKKKINCPHCEAELTKRECERAIKKVYDSTLGKEIELAKEIPVLINYNYYGNDYDKEPDKDDIELIRKINEIEIPYWFPVIEIPNGYNTKQPKMSHNFSYLHHFYTKRALYSISKIFNLLYKSNSSIKQYLIYTFEQVILGMAKIARYVPTHYSQVNQYLSGTLYVGSQRVDVSPEYILENKIKRLKRALIELNNIKNGSAIISTQSIIDFRQIENDKIDYIFTDPPFGDNLMYSELNFMHEAWLKVFTNNQTEAIVNKTQNKELEEYTNLMTKAFKEMYRILKPNRWMTVVFHNSKASVWNAIQESIARAGFIIAQVTTMDKKQGSFKQVTSAGAVKNDLIINAYKPKKEFEEEFLKNAGEGMEVDFVAQQLDHLPVGPNIERTEKMLYSKMLAHYVENGFKIKYNASNFYSLLHDNFVDMDGYWFLEDQVDVYNKWKSSLKLDELKDIRKGNQVLFVVDEKSALTWLYSFLDEPKEYGEIYTNYEQIVTKTDDEIPELREMLDNNFILEDGKYRRPETKEEKARIDKSREKELDRAWKELLNRAKNSNRKIKNVRKEALIHGFTKCYQEENYEDILIVADALYTSTLESSGDIMDFVDIARIKLNS